MTLPAGTKLGSYEILGPLGAGGMGEVYRARDPQLTRDVAIKILPASFSSDPDRLRRFEQEARAAAALNHPNILSVFYFGTYEKAPYLVCELLEGETLRERLRVGALPVRKAVDFATQVARGLAAAHAKGIVHRDLKPENIFLTRDGRVKILDFGLAKLTQVEPAAQSETATLQTEPGVAMGTVGYMSPEQVRGLNVDYHSDLFSLGAILYEMLSGKRAFHKPTAPETLTAILHEDPATLPEGSASVSPGLQRVILRCLEKNPSQRFQSASDLAFALEELSGSGSSTAVSQKGVRPKTYSRWLALAVAVALAGAALYPLLSRRASDAPPVQVQAAILPPTGDGFWANLTQPAAISPDGKFLAIVAMHNGQRQLWLRKLNASDAQLIAGSEDAANPFWSPDSRHIAFFAYAKLKKVDVAGGQVTDLCPAGTFNLGGSWSSRGDILFAPLADTLKHVSESGGLPESIPGIPLSDGFLGQEWPTFLPDGNHFAYLEWKYPSAGKEENTVRIGSLDGQPPRKVPLTSTNVEFSGGYLLFSREGDLFAQKFDPDHLELKGAALPIARNIQFDTFFNDGSFTVSKSGILVYAPAGTGVNSRLTWMDRNGASLATLGDPQHFETQAISPDGKRVIVGIKPANARENLWIYDVERGTRVPLDPSDTGPTLYSCRWSPDGKQVAYRNTVGNTSALLVHDSDGSGHERQVGEQFDGAVTVEDWSPDGKYVLVNHSQFLGKQNWHDNLRLLPVAGEDKPLMSIDNAIEGKFSPDAHWLAYYDGSTGQVYVRPFGRAGGAIAVSSSGGSDPRWRGDGQELFYITDELMLVSVQVRESAQEFRVLSSRPLFRLPLPFNVGFYDVTRDGKRFLVNARTPQEQMAPLTLVTNWSAQFK